MACGLARGRIHPHILVGCSVLMAWMWNGGEATNATNTTNTTGAPEASTAAVHDGPVTFNIADTIPQIVLTMIVVACSIIIGVVIGKVAERLYDRHMANRDDISDISEHTREILKANVAKLKKKNKDETAENDTNAQDKPSPSKKTLLSVWTTSKRTSLVTPSPREPKANIDNEITTPQIQVTNIDDDAFVDIVDETQNKNSNSGNGEEADDKGETLKAGKENEKSSEHARAFEVNNNSGNENHPVKLEDMENEEAGNKSSNERSKSTIKQDSKDDETGALTEANKEQTNDENGVKAGEQPEAQSAETSKL